MRVSGRSHSIMSDSADKNPGFDRSLAQRKGAKPVDEARGEE